MVPVRVGAFTRDAGYLMINIVPLFMFATPIFYAQSSCRRRWDIWIYVNALTGYVEVMRDIVLRRQAAQLAGLWLDAVHLGLTFYFGYWFFDRYRNVIVDVI